MTRKSSVRHEPEAPVGSQRGPASAPDGAPMAQLAAMWMGLPWLELWMRGWEAWYGPLCAAIPQADSASAQDRRKAAVPWMPQVDATVIPFRRRDDAPGQEATRWSLRLHVPAPPWLGASSNVIAIDTLLPRGREGDTEP